MKNNDSKFNQKPVPLIEQDYQKKIIGSFIKFLISAVEEGISDNRINSLIKSANNTLEESRHQIIYERDGGNSFNIYLK